jgi:hypothetical protein
MTMIRGSDGLEYADEAALLLREPLDNTFNGNVQSYRRNAEQAAEAARLGVRVGPSAWTEAKVRRYIEGFLAVCPQGYPGPSQAFAVAHDTGLEAAGFRSRRQSLAQANQYIAERMDRAAFAVLSGKSPTFAIFDDVATGNPTLSAV